MQRIKNHKIKRELPETSSARLTNEEHDLAYYIHDRVELMHQVFSVIKPKELKAMAPECVQHISIDDLQELCTEELLGISSKRLCAILDGAGPPSDTESSASEQLETISLDSISSDDEILSQPSSKSKKHKHKKHKSKSKHKHRNSNSNDREAVEDRSKASRAGLTVLELLELQARARAIRAQLQQDNINMSTEQVKPPEKNDSSDEVEIKEEPPEVVEISSEDEKPKIEDLLVRPTSPQKEEEENVQDCSENSTKRINNLIITVPQSKPSRKIKLKRNKTVNVSTQPDAINKPTEKKDICGSIKNTESNDSEKSLGIQKPKLHESKKEQHKSDIKPKKKQKKKSKTIEKDGSDHDEITLELSDTEKMDLLEDFNRKDYENFTSSDSKDSESNSENECDKLINNEEIENIKTSIVSNDLNKPLTDVNTNLNVSNEIEEQQFKNNINKKNVERIPTDTNNADISDEKNSDNLGSIINQSSEINNDKKEGAIINEETAKQNEVYTQDITTGEHIEEGEIVNTVLSEGELSDKNSLEVDTCDKLSEIVCISDEESKIIKSNKTHKKDKKSKKEKNTDKSKDFSDTCDQNFFKDNEYKKADKINQQSLEKPNSINPDNIVTIYDEDNEIVEVFELSDDSSYSDIEESSVLSKEPTAAEIAALSAKIDEIHNEDIVTDNQEIQASFKDDQELENISWRDRYLGSKKVKKVLTTASILNALRKKNKELKTKLEVAKNDNEMNPQVCEYESTAYTEGSIEHFNTLQASTKYVNPVVIESKEESKKNTENRETKLVTKEMEKDAKILLKMYKKLLKYNDMNKQKDPTKKKKKKQKKSKDKEKVKKSQ